MITALAAFISRLPQRLYALRPAERYSIPHPPFLRCCLRIHDGKSCGVHIYKSRGRLERCELWGNADGGVSVDYKGDPTFASCTLRDHAAGRAFGVHLCTSSNVRVGADCVFARNAGGDVVRGRRR